MSFLWYLNEAYFFTVCRHLSIFLKLSEENHYDDVLLSSHTWCVQGSCWFLLLLVDRHLTGCLWALLWRSVCFVGLFYSGTAQNLTTSHPAVLDSSEWIALFVFWLLALVYYVFLLVSLLYHTVVTYFLLSQLFPVLSLGLPRTSACCLMCSSSRVC